jgi:hypothetical protein
MKKVLIVGATSAIAQETAKCFAVNGDALFLAGRNEIKLQAVMGDLKVRGAQKVDSLVLDLNDTAEHARLLERACQSLGGLDIVLIAYGTLPDQKKCEASFALTQKALETNFLSAISILTLLANYFEQQKSGAIAVITSVAGDRGRPSNYIYGTAKGALSLFLQGLRARLSKSNVTVLTIKPGFVDTPMTAHLKKGFLFASPEAVGRGIYQAILKKMDVVYLPWRWRWIMLIVKLIPESVFKKINL